MSIIAFIASMKKTQIKQGDSWFFFICLFVCFFPLIQADVGFQCSKNFHR